MPKRKAESQAPLPNRGVQSTMCKICYDQVANIAPEWETDDAPLSSSTSEAGPSRCAPNPFGLPPRTGGNTEASRHSLEALGCGHIYHEVCANKYFKEQKSESLATLPCPMGCPPSRRIKLHLEIAELQLSWDRNDSLIEENARLKQALRDSTFEKRNMRIQMTNLSARITNFEAKMAKLKRENEALAKKLRAAVFTLFSGGSNNDNKDV